MNPQPASMFAFFPALLRRAHERIFIMRKIVALVRARLCVAVWTMPLSYFFDVVTLHPHH